MTIVLGEHSIVPASGFFGNTWPQAGAIPTSFSSAGWTTDARGFVQQTFLGASIRNFNMNGGFGDTSSTLSIDLINDEYNKSDETGQGLGDDVYHAGFRDTFVPPIMGAPVFFKFGRNFATVQEAYVQTFDDLYGVNTLVGEEEETGEGGDNEDNAGNESEGNTDQGTNEPSDVGDFDINNFTSLSDNQYVDLATNKIKDYTSVVTGPDRGRNHLVFGGILQSVVENRSPAGDPLYSVQVIDPREILSNVVLVLNNYAGTTYNNNNMYNIYGFLEYNPTDAAIDELTGFYSQSGIVQRFVQADGQVLFSGVNPSTNQIISENSGYDEFFKDSESSSSGDNLEDPSSTELPPKFPITGTGFSRRCSQGMPYYRVNQALRTLFKFDGILPEEYEKMGFGGFINFRGFHYVVDLGGLPKLPKFYYLDFDQISLLDLALEVCDVTSRDLFVTLLPVIDHPSCSFLYSWNQQQIAAGDKDKLVAGIIRLDTIDRTKQPNYGAIKSFLEGLADSGVYVENRDLGFELSNVTTDKFIVGAQEVDMHYFSSNNDRDNLEIRKQQNGENSELDLGKQWKLETSLEQQILPYYGKIGKDAVTIPKGFGAYQQILLDASNVNANGVGQYYVATEMELRCALISFERWKEFLVSYNDVYLESIETDDAIEGAALAATPLEGLEDWPIEDISNNYAVTVPRSVFPTDNQDSPYGDDGLPSSPCNPPYGYPLYYKRATKIGIPEAGLTNVSSKYTQIITNLAKIKNSANEQDVKILLNNQWTQIKSQLDIDSPIEKQIIEYVENILQNSDVSTADVIGFVEEQFEGITKQLSSLPRIAKKATENALRVYNFVKNVAEECLGKKFLVKIPKHVNLWYRNKIGFKGGDGSGEYEFGPFGFKPRPTNSGVGYEFSTEFYTEKTEARSSIEDNMIRSFLINDHAETLDDFAGALRVNFNPIADQYEFNYEPINYGGFFNFDLLSNLLPKSQQNAVQSEGFDNLPLGIKQGIVPLDLTNFINENGRVNAYVRFDHSQKLAFDTMNSESFTQQEIKGNFLIPDIAENLDNTTAEGNEFTRFPNPNDKDDKKDEQSKKEEKDTMAFVKCQVDEKLYMPPKTIARDIKVYGIEIKDIGKIVKPNKILDKNTGQMVDAIPYYKAHWVPNASGDTGSTSANVLDFKRKFDTPTDESVRSDSNIGLSSGIIESSLEHLDTDHVYALITLPGRVIPVKDARFRDGPFQNANAEALKHLLSMDVVKGLTEFENPPYKNDADPTSYTNLIAKYTEIDEDAKFNANLAYQKVLDTLSFAFPQQINMAMPSPVYPDLVAIPLMSKERCYGPWISSQIDRQDPETEISNIGDVQATAFANIGGRIEFIKDENLAPWNYAGYKGMNEAGNLQAAFSNSLLLFSERGGFTVPTEPSGVSLGKALLNNGPLVTNINVDISENGIRSTYQLELYTSSFGKLQKQKADEISKSSRERQKLKDERNALIRKNIGKNQRSENYHKMIEDMNNILRASEDALALYNDLQSRALTPTYMVASVKKQDRDLYSSTLATGVKDQKYGVEMAMQSQESLGVAAQNFATKMQAAVNYYNSAGSALSDNQTPASLDFYHHSMSHKHPSFIHARQKIYEKQEDEDFSQLDISLYEG
jgi:hypothetical protein